MKSKLIVYLCLFVSLLLSQETNIETVVLGADTVEIFNDEIVYQLKPGVSEALLHSRGKAFGAASVHVSGKHKIGHLKFKSKIKVTEKVKELKNSGLFDIVEPAYVRRPHLVTPNDSYYQQGKQYAVDKIRLREAWDITQGNSSTLVGILDTGIPMSGSSLSHPDLNSTSRFLKGFDATNENDNSVRDGYGHGAHVLGIAGAMSNNSTGIAGADWRSKFRMSQVFTASGSGTQGAFSNAVYNAVDYGVKVINYSGGGPVYSAVDEQAIEYARSHGVLIIASAGNNKGGAVGYPAKLANEYDNLIAVSATDANDRFASFSSQGPEVTLAAPGAAIMSSMPNYSVYLNGVKNEVTDNKFAQNYDYMNGTSMSAPYVTGVAALMYSANPNLTPAEAKSIFVNTALDKGAYGRDNYYGAGRLNAYRAVKAAKILNDSPTAKYIKKSKSSSVVLDKNTYKIVWNNQVYLAKRYRMDVTIDLKNYLQDYTQAMVWYNSNGMSAASPNNNIVPWYTVVSQSGSQVTVRTYTFEYWDLSGRYMGWTTPKSELKVDLLAYGVEYVKPPFTAYMSGPSSISHPFSKGSGSNTSTWTANVSGGSSPYTYKWYKDNYQVSTSSSYSRTLYWDGYGGGSTQFNLRLEVRDATNKLISSTKTITEYHSGGIEPFMSVQINGNTIPTEYSVFQNYPNPFNPTTTISYALPKAGTVKLTVYNALGQAVKRLVNEYKPIGRYDVRWDAGDVASGVYIYRIEAGEFRETKKMILMK